jgi:sodium/potassium/calcium exchanger 6
MMLGSTADDFFSPALIVLSKKMNLSDRTAGVTLLALGNGAPDLFSVLNSIYTPGGKPQVGLALGDLTGGGNFVVTVVLAALLGLVGDAGLKAEGMFLRDSLYVLYCLLVIFIGPRVPPCLKKVSPQQSLDSFTAFRHTRAIV